MKKTLNDWMEEFYPIPASSVEGGNKELLEHSLKKWKGATKENTEVYNYTYKDHCITGKGYYVLGFGFDTCALCQVHKYENAKRWEGCAFYDCNECIIVTSGNLPCSHRSSAYAKSKDDPSPMIDLLEKLLNENQP